MARSYDPIRENIKENIKLQTLLQKYQISINPNSMEIVILRRRRKRNQRERITRNKTVKEVIASANFEKRGNMGE